MKSNEITPQAVEHEQGSEHQFSPDKAHGDFRLVAHWLARRTLTEKLCLWAGSVLLDGDTQAALQSSEAYDGEIGRDLWTAWGRELTDLLVHSTPDSTLDAEAQNVLAYVAALQSGRR